MSTTSTVPTVPTETQQALLDQRTQAIAEAEAAIAKIAEEKAAGRKGGKGTEIARQGAILATRKARIGNLELDLAVEGHTVEPWQQAPQKTGQLPVSQESVEASLAKLGSVYKTTTFEAVKANADKRIQALLKVAKEQSYKVTDPRK